MSSPPIQRSKVKAEPTLDMMDLEEDDAPRTAVAVATASSNDALHLNLSLNEEIVSSAEAVLSGASAVDPNVVTTVGGGPVVAAGEEGEDEDDGDEVVRVIDVFISPTLTRQLHLVQFPLTPGCAGGGDYSQHPLPAPTAARVKPRHNLLELDVPVPAAASSPDRQLPDALHLSHRTFASGTIAARTHLGLGVLGPDGRSVHVTPLSNDVVQMRPTFRHIDEATRDEGDDDDGDGGGAAAASEAAAAEAKRRGQSPLLLKKKESERAAAMRKSSYAYKVASEEGEEWVDLDIRARGTAEQRRARRAALCPDSGRILTLAPSRGGGTASYVDTLNYLPRVVDEEIRSAATAAGGDEDATVRDLAARLATLLQRGVPAPFPLLRRRFPHVSTPDLLAALSGCAVLVRGNLVLKSSLCGLAASARDVRDAILALMNRDGAVRRECMADFGVSEEVLNHVLSPLARRVGGGWEMKFEDDDEFAGLYPEFAAMQHAFWTRREGQLAEYLESYDRYAAGDGDVGDCDGNDESQGDWTDQQ